MDFRLTKEQVEFQEEVRDFLRTEKEKEYIHSEITISYT